MRFVAGFVMLAVCAVACATTEPDVVSSQEQRATGDLAGSCVDTCDGQSSTGSCWCDEFCIEWGDCCVDKAEICGTDECFESDDCAGDSVCMPGVCLLYCAPEDPGCCGPNNCVSNTACDVGEVVCEGCGGEPFCMPPGTETCPIAACPPPQGPCEPDEMECAGCNGEPLCVPNNDVGCPEINCPPPSGCEPGETACPGCGTPICIPDEQGVCPDIMCAPCEVSDEQECIDRPECTPLYGPSCDVCQDVSYQGCVGVFE